MGFQIELLKSMGVYSPTELADRVCNASVEEAHCLGRSIADAGVKRLTGEHARELLCVAGGLTEWYRIMAVLIIGEFFFESEFVDFAIDVLCRPRPEESSQGVPTAEHDLGVVKMWACNLLVSRKSISAGQFDRILRLPDDSFGKRTLVDTLRCRIR